LVFGLGPLVFVIEGELSTLDVEEHKNPSPRPKAQDRSFLFTISFSQGTIETPSSLYPAASSPQPPTF